jgi:formamidopyrimidine-DNA glycosylase
MPELPEVETMRRKILGAVGAVIQKVTRPRSRYRPLAMTPEWRSFHTSIVGRRIVAVDRIAKRVLVRLDDGRALVFQPKMAGLVLADDPPTEGHVRMVLHLDSPSMPRIIYWDQRGLGSIHLWDAKQQANHLGPDKLGPDALAITESKFFEIFHRVKRPIKVALLDQRLLAGVGNLYASEILHRAQVSPLEKCTALDRAAYRRLHRVMRLTLIAAIRYEGSTLSDGTYAKSKQDPGSYQQHHRVYARDGEHCPRCRQGTIRRIVQAQRSTFYCPKCQTVG